MSKTKTRPATYARGILALACLLYAPVALAQQHSLRSPDGRTEIRIELRDKLSYSVWREGAVLLQPSAISLTLSEPRSPAVPLRILRKDERTVRTTVHPVVRTKRKEIPERFNELRLTLTGSLILTLRAYDDGVACRWSSSQTGEFTVMDEQVTFALDPQDIVFFAEEESFFSHNERRYMRYAPAEIGAEKMASLPALVAKPSGVKLWLSEANLRDYAGLWLGGTGTPQLAGLFPRYPLEEQQTRDRDIKVTKRASYIARTRGPRTFPWRVVGIADRDADLLNNQLVYLLSQESRGDFSWVRPGKVPWDWWNAWRVYGVDFDAGINTTTYKYYIDFAARYGLEYLILDEGWSKQDDLLSINPAINMPELLAYAREKKVGIVLWVLWTALDKQFDATLDQFERWGIKGLKVDFMQRDDQKMVNFYERVARAAARRKMLVDFHGAYKPSGLERTYPNVVTREGVLGLEHNKWSENVTPEHDLTLPFIRMVAGPMDYTPGAMRNARKEDFRPIFSRPMSQGTRCHQLAMYVVYESPLQMLADSPSDYLGEPEAMQFLGPVPTVWDETIPLDGRVGEFVAVARRAANGDWYVGALTNSSARDLTIELNFLPEGDYGMQVWEDGANAARVASDFRTRTVQVKKGDHVTIRMAPGGGWVAQIRSSAK
jgi:alpha-glucosidase